MTKKRFIIEFESADTTRWLYNDKEFARILEEVCQPSATFLTQGPKPLVRVIKDEKGGKQ